MRIIIEGRLGFKTGEIIFGGIVFLGEVCGYFLVGMVGNRRRNVLSMIGC